ncbi:MAG: methyl-accepting chemotaxis protein [Candidatus Neomarinimicrobiota bacterium]
MKLNATIASKLLLGFGIVLLIFAISGVLTITLLRDIGNHLDNIISVRQPANAAAYEMEINLIGTGFGLLGYLEDRDPKHLERIKDDIEDFGKYHKEYRELEKTEEARELAITLGKEYDTFKDLANKIIALEDEQDKKIVTLFNNHELMDNLLDEKIQVSIKSGEPQAYEKMQAAMELEINVNGIAKGLGEYLRTHQTQYEDRVLKDETDFRRFLKVYEGLSLTFEERQWASEIGRLFENSATLSEEIIKIDKDIGTGRDEFVRIRRSMDVLMDDEIQVRTNKDLEISEDEAKRSNNFATTMILVFLLSGIIIGSLAAVFITRSITGPLIMVVDRVSEIAGSAGDLTAEVPVTTKDEVGDLAGAFNKMLRGLKEMIIKIMGNAASVSASSQQLSSSAQQTNASAQQVSSTIQQLAKGAQSQAERVEETTRVMEQLNAAITQSAQSAGQAAAASTRASQSAQRGAETVKESVETMDKISDTTTVTSEAVSKLGERSEQMAEIVDVITNVADQTNLLALNAAIEAARAGEAGRGFAVVAEEVRKLAESSGKSASEIGDLIKQTIKETNEAVKNMDTTSREVTAGKDLITKSGAALEEIVAANQNVSTMLQQISAASQQMSSGARQVVGSVEEVATIAEEASTSTQQAGASTQQMVATMQEMTSSAQSLAEMGVELNNLVSEFKTGEEVVKRAPVKPAPPMPKHRPVTPSVVPLNERLSEARKKMEKIREPFPPEPKPTSPKPVLTKPVAVKPKPSRPEQPKPTLSQPVPKKVKKEIKPENKVEKKPGDKGG